MLAIIYYENETERKTIRNIIQNIGTDYIEEEESFFVELMEGEENLFSGFEVNY